MKTILFVIVILSLFAMAFGPSVTQPPQPPPQKTKPPTEPPPPPPPTEPPQITEPPEKPTEPSEPPEHGVTPEPKVTPWSGGGEKAEPKEIRLPQGGYGPQPEHDLYYWLRWFLLVLVGFVGVWAAGWSLKR